MKKLPQKYVILEIIPTASKRNNGFIAQIQALKIKNEKIIGRLDIRLSKNLISNNDLLNMISYDEEMFRYLDNASDMQKELMAFVDNDILLIIDNDYTKDYLEVLKNKKEAVFSYLDLEISDKVFNEMISKYQLEPSNHLVDLLYEALMFETHKE